MIKHLAILRHDIPYDPSLVALWTISQQMLNSSSTSHWMFALQKGSQIKPCSLFIPCTCLMHFFPCMLPLFPGNWIWIRRTDWMTTGRRLKWMCRTGKTIIVSGRLALYKMPEQSLWKQLDANNLQVKRSVDTYRPSRWQCLFLALDC